MATEMEQKTEWLALKQEHIANGKNFPALCTAARFFMNSTKNRYKNILAPDHSRVVLGDEGGQFDGYINASIIKDDSLNLSFIAAQAPIKSVRANTMGDWWEMIWSRDVSVIFMLTKLMEKQKRKAEKYWTAVGDSQVCGQFTITTVEEKVLPSFSSVVVRTFLLEKKGDDVPRSVVQYHYTGWPDFGVPTDDGFDEYIRLLKLQLPKDTPTVVHCSAGIGRSGTFIACHYAMKQLAANNPEPMDVKSIITDLREKRHGMVQTLEQYQYIYKVVSVLRKES